MSSVIGRFLTVNGTAAGCVTATLALASLLFLPATGSAQVQTLTVDLVSLSTEEWPAAQAVVTILDGDGRPLTGLAEDHFQATLNGSLVSVTSVTRAVDSAVGIAVVLALDVSGSMSGGALAQAKGDAQLFLDGLGPEDSFAIIAFSDTVQSLLGFTQDKDAARAAIAGLTASGDTALYEATDASVRLAVDSGIDRRAVVLLTDGRNDSPTFTRSEALATVQTSDVPIFAIGIGADIDRSYLQEVAEMSGGRFTETPSLQGLTQLYDEVAELLRGQYILTFDGSAASAEKPKAVALSLDVVVGEQAGAAARTFAPNGPAVILLEIAPDELIEAERIVTAQVISADLVTSVTFSIDGEPQLAITEPPYTFTFDPSSLEDGDHALQVAVTTSAGETATTALQVRTLGAGGVVADEVSGGGRSGTLIAAALILLAAVAGAIILLVLRRRHRGGASEADSPDEELPPGLAGLGKFRREFSPRPLWGEAAKRDDPNEEPRPAPEAAPLLGRLVVTGGSLAGQTFKVSDVPVSIGSGQSCVVQLVDATGEEEIASEAARVWVRGGQLMVHELRRLSAAGSMSGGWTMLGPGEAFTIGPCTFTFEITDEEGIGPAQNSAEAQAPPNILRDRTEQSDDSEEQRSAELAGEGSIE